MRVSNLQTFYYLFWVYYFIEDFFNLSGMMLLKVLILFILIWLFWLFP